MEESACCVYCGATIPPGQPTCQTCGETLDAGEINTTLLADAINVPMLLTDITSTWALVLLIILGLLGIGTGFFRMEALAEVGLAYVGYGLIFSGVLIVVSVILLRFKTSLPGALLFILGGVLQGLILVAFTRFLSSDFFVGLVFLVLSGLVAWRIPNILRLGKIPRPILDHAKRQYARLFTEKVDAEDRLIVFQNADEKVTRALVEDRVVLLADNPKKMVRVKPRAQFKIVTPEAVNPGEKPKIALKFGNELEYIKILPQFLDKYHNLA